MPWRDRLGRGRPACGPGIHHFLEGVQHPEPACELHHTAVVGQLPRISRKRDRACWGLVPVEVDEDQHGVIFIARAPSNIPQVRDVSTPAGLQTPSRQNVSARG